MIRKLPLIAWLNGEPHHRVGVALFQRAIGLSLLFRVITEAPFAGFLWGPHSVASEGSVGRVFGAGVGRVADGMFASTTGTYAVLAVLAAGAAGLLFQRATRLSAILACVAFNVLGARLPELQDGGDNLATISLMYMIALVPAGSSAAAGSLRAWLHNLGALAIVAQVCIVYFVAGFMKMYGDSWHNGTALYLISQVEWFSSPATRSWFTNPIIATASAYSTMLFQVWFPIALLSRLKLWFLAVAMLFHLGIAVSMGLLTFSLIMTGADLSLVSDAEYAQISTWIRDAVRRFRARRWGKAILFIDGDCAMCQAFARKVDAFDLSRTITIRSFRNTAEYTQFGITAEMLEQKMHLVLVDGDHEVHAGYGVLPLLAWRMPPFWPSIALLRVVEWLGLGNVMYRAVASRRFALSGAACDERCVPPQW